MPNFGMPDKSSTEDDILRFFQYVASLHVMKNKKVELYILCTKKAPYTTKEVILSDDCTYTMNVISLKHISAEKIFKTIENKIKHNHEITCEDIAALQLIAYTDYAGTTLNVLKKAYNLVERMNLDANEKLAIIYILNILSANMLNEHDKKEYLEETTMMINPRDEYMKNKGIEEGKKEGIEEGKNESKKEIAKNLKEILPVEEIAKHTGLSVEKIKTL